MITSQTPLVQVPNPGYVLKSFTMFRPIGQKWQASGSLAILDNNNQEVDSLSFTVPIADWNAFWAGFNNGTFLYQLANTQNNLGLTIPDLSQENDFIN